MQKYMCLHTLPPHALSSEQIQQLAEAGQRDPLVRGYRSFINTSEGKVFCVIESPDKETVARWFEKLNVPVDGIWPVELEGDRGTIHEELAVGTA